jgi:hypothetical protein
LLDGEDAFAAEFPAFLPAHAGQKAEIVCLHSRLPTVVAKLALRAVPIQDQIGWRRAGEQRSEVPEVLSYFAIKGRGLYPQLDVVAAVDDFPEADFASERFGKYERIEGEQQLVVFRQLVPEDKTDGNESCRFAPAIGRRALDGLETRFDEARMRLRLSRNALRKLPPD